MIQSSIESEGSQEVGTPAGCLVESGPRSAAQPSEAAQYIARMTRELATIARASKLEILAYFLDMARIEATSRSEPSGDTR